MKADRTLDRLLHDAIPSHYRCEWCGTAAWTDCHHIKSVGSGGKSTVKNLALLCREDHGKAHAGNIAKRPLKRIAENQHRIATIIKFIGDYMARMREKNKLKGAGQ